VIKKPITFVLFATAIFLSGCGGGEREANSCSDFSGKYTEGKFTKECINSILMTFITNEPKGFFIIQINDEKNIYVQGARNKDDSFYFYFEAVSPKYASSITPESLNLIAKLDWSLPDDDNNFRQMISYDQILNKEATNLLFKTLQSYDLEQHEIVFEYKISEP
tara:strand:- start:148 stop:639 length:492 start_codon:yes stop_codon:yes gene_type:complete